MIQDDEERFYLKKRLTLRDLLEENEGYGIEGRISILKDRKT